MEIKNTLNKYFEIIGLLYTCAHPDLLEKELWEKAAAEYSINVEDLTRKIGPAPIKYFSVFQKSMSVVSQEDFDFFFADEDDNFILLLQCLSTNHSNWFENELEGVTAEKIITAIADILSDSIESKIPIPPSTNEIIDLLKFSGYSSSTCWKLVLILQSPKESIGKLFNIIQNNLPAYEKAIASVNHTLNKLLCTFPQGKSFCNPLHQGVDFIFPTLIYPTLELVSTTGTLSTSYIGVLVNDLYQMLEQARTAKEKLLPVLKALSDNSKFDILLSLQKSPKYNLEIAEELNLTAATVSHHMNVLLSHQLVVVEKRDGRVYYTTSKDTIRETIQSLTQVLLG